MKFLLFLFLFYILTVALLFLRKLWQVKKQGETFLNAMQREMDDLLGRTTRPEDSTQSASGSHQNRKIIPDGEGEYVDFEETEAQQ